MTENITIKKGNDYQKLDASIMTNRGLHNLEYLTNNTPPSSSLKGHFLAPLDGQSRSELPDGDLYVRCVFGDVLLAYSV